MSLVGRPNSIPPSWNSCKFRLLRLEDDDDGPCVPMVRKCAPPSPPTLMKMGALFAEWASGLFLVTVRRGSLHSQDSPPQNSAGLSLKPLTSLVLDPALPRPNPNPRSECTRTQKPSSPSKPQAVQDPEIPLVPMVHCWCQVLWSPQSRRPGARSSRGLWRPTRRVPPQVGCRAD